MQPSSNNSFAFILLSHGGFGGAEKRFLTLYFHLIEKYAGRYFFFVSQTMMEQIKGIFKGKNYENIIVIDSFTHINADFKPSNSKRKLATSLKSNVLIFLKKNVLYKIFYYNRSKKRYMVLFQKIDKVVKDNSISSILGIYTGIFPLYLYLEQKERPGIIFSNMDSWFSHLSTNVEKDWYKKFDLFNYAHKKADLLDVLSPFILKGLTERNIQFDKSKVNITECSFVDYTKCSVSKKDPISIVFSARLEKDKNPLLFVQAAIPLAKKYPNVQFHIIGKGRAYDEVKQNVQEQSLFNINVHGFLKDPIQVLKSSLVFVSLQTTNNYPSQSVLEAMACGNAIIATDVGDTRLFINEHNGTLIDLSLNSLINSMEYYIKNPEIAENKGKFASNSVKNEFTVEKAASYYLKLFQRSIHAKYENS